MGPGTPNYDLIGRVAAVGQCVGVELDDGTTALVTWPLGSHYDAESGLVITADGQIGLGAELEMAKGKLISANDYQEYLIGTNGDYAACQTGDLPIIVFHELKGFYFAE